MSINIWQPDEDNWQWANIIIHHLKFPLTDKDQYFQIVFYDNCYIYKKQCNKKWNSSSTPLLVQKTQILSSLGSPWNIPVLILIGIIPHLNWAKVDRKYLGISKKE